VQKVEQNQKEEVKEEMR